MIKKYSPPQSHKPYATQAYIFLAVSLALTFGAVYTASAYGRENTFRDDPIRGKGWSTDTLGGSQREIGGSDPSAGDSGYAPDVCGLEVVGGRACGDGLVHGKETGYDLSSYATHPQHLQRLQAIYEAIPNIRSAQDAETYIRTRYPGSPVTGTMAWRAAEAYDVDVRLMLAVMEQDSSIGTAGIGARTNNPGNIGNTGSDTRTYPSWQAGVDAVASWLDKHWS